MQKFYFTFGFGQVHEGGFHIIEADHYMQARKKMHERFGSKWAFQYPEDDWFNKDGISQQEKYGLHEVI